MTYKQLAYEERIILITLKQQGLPIRAIARRLGRHFSTLYRELDRNRCDGVDTAYRAFSANRRAVARRRHSRRNRHYSNCDFILVRKLLMKKWSPEQIAGHLRRHRLISRLMSHETICQYIWRDKAESGSLQKYLRQSSRQR